MKFEILGVDRDTAKKIEDKINHQLKIMGEINAEFKKLTDLLEKTQFKEWVLSGNMDKLSDEVRHQIGVIANKLETMAPIDLAHVVHNKTIRSWCKLFPVTNFYTKIPKRAM